jgi:hypothetical protein
VAAGDLCGLEVDGFLLASGLVAADTAGSSLHARDEGKGAFMPDERLTPESGSARPPEEGISSQPLTGGRPASDDDWFVQLGGKEVGPFTAEEMRADAAGGTLAPDHLVRKRGGEWAPAKDRPFLQAVFRRALVAEFRRRAAAIPHSLASEEAGDASVVYLPPPPPGGADQPQENGWLGKLLTEMDSAGGAPRAYQPPQGPCRRCAKCRSLMALTAVESMCHTIRLLSEPIDIPTGKRLYYRCARCGKQIKVRSLRRNLLALLGCLLFLLWVAMFIDSTDKAVKHDLQGIVFATALLSIAFSIFPLKLLSEIVTRFEFPTVRRPVSPSPRA